MGACFSCSLCWENTTLVETNDVKSRYTPPTIEMKELNINKPNIDKPIIDKSNIDKPNIDKLNIDKPNIDKPNIDKSDILIYDNFIGRDKYIEMIDQIMNGKEILGNDLEKLWLLYGDNIIDRIEKDGEYGKILLFKLHLMPDLIKFDNLIKFGRMIVRHNEQIGIVLLSVKEDELNKVMNKDEYNYLISKKIHILMRLGNKYKDEKKYGNLYIVYKYIGDESGSLLILNKFMPEYVRKLI